MTFYKTPQDVYDQTLGKSIDVDNFPKSQEYQCWDLFAYFCQKENLDVDLYCDITRFAGDLYKKRYEKGYNKYFEFFYPRNAKRGDWIFWSGHVAMVWDVDLQADRVLCLGQNQGGAPYVNLKWYKLSTALGCMRFKEWIEMRNGWIKEGKHWCYYRGGKKVTGWQRLKWSKGEDWFYFSEAGIMLTGWQKLKWSGGENWFYFNTDGCMVGGFRKLKWLGKDDWYFFDENTGAMLKNTKIRMELEFDESGKLIGGQRV